MHDAIIIGAGPAGSLAALLLARAGWGVTLIEQHRFPRDKVCGECLSALGCEVLDRRRLLAGLTALGARPLCRALLCAHDGAAATVDLPRQMLGISRRALDAYLLEQARSAGAAIVQPARCESVESSDQHVEVKVRDLQTNQVSVLLASIAIIADGKGALPDRPPAPTCDLGIKSHWIGVESPDDAIALFGCDGCYGGLAPIEDKRWNAAFSVPVSRLRQYRGDVDALFDDFLFDNPALRRSLARARQVKEWIASPLPRFGVSQNWSRRIIPIGNAVAAIEPIGGEGMGLALRSAEIATEAITLNGDGPVDAKSLQHQFKKLWRAPKMMYRMGAIIASSKNLSRAMVPMLRANQDFARSFLQVMGK